MSNDTPNNDTRLLLIADVDLEIEPNHRFFHVVDYVASDGLQVDFVSFNNLYGGPETSLWKKIIRSVSNLLYDRRRQWQVDNVRYTVIRRLKLPQWMQNLVGEFWAYANLPRQIRNGHYAACIYSHPHLALTVRRMARRGVFPHLIYDDCDYFPDGPDARGRLARHILAWKEHVAIGGADAVLSVSEPLAALRQKMGARQVRVAPNGVPITHFTQAAISRPHNQHPPTLVYVGLLADGWTLAPVIEAIPQIRAFVPDIRLLVIGYGEQLAALKQQATRLHIADRVTFTGRVPYAELPDYLAQADIAIALFEERPFNRYACHLKIREYIAAGLPVIASAIGDTAVLLDRSQTGILLKNTDRGAIAAAAIQLLIGDNSCETYATNARAFAPELDWSRTLAPLSDTLRQFLVAHSYAGKTGEDVSDVKNSISLEPATGKSQRL